MVQPEKSRPKQKPHDLPMTDEEIVQWEVDQLSKEEPTVQRREGEPRRGEAEGPPSIRPDIEAEKEARRARELAKESEEEAVERAVEKRFIRKAPPRTGRTHGTGAR